MKLKDTIHDHQSRIDSLERKINHIPKDLNKLDQNAEKLLALRKEVKKKLAQVEGLREMMEDSRVDQDSYSLDFEHLELPGNLAELESTHESLTLKQSQLEIELAMKMVVSAESAPQREAHKAADHKKAKHRALEETAGRPQRSLR